MWYTYLENDWLDQKKQCYCIFYKTNKIIIINIEPYKTFVIITIPDRSTLNYVAISWCASTYVTLLSYIHGKKIREPLYFKLNIYLEDNKLYCRHIEINVGFVGF